MRTSQIIIYICVVLFNLDLFADNNKKEDVLLYFSGDVTFAEYFEQYVQNRFEYPFAKLKWFADADISMINLENPLTERGTKIEKKYNYRAKPDYVQILLNSGIDIVTLANNHIYDYGESGIYDTIKHLDENNIYYVGAGRNQNEARHPVIFNIKGYKIAYFAYYGTQKHGESFPATEDSAGTALRNLDIIQEDLRRYRNKVDFITVNFHWGDEKADHPGQDQIYFAHKVIEGGADVIVGHHPHVLQGVEKYQNKIIAYSLGNFIFGGNSRPTEDSVILEIRITKSGEIDASVIPVRINLWQPFRLEGEEGEKVVNKVKELSMDFDQSIF